MTQRASTKRLMSGARFSHALGRANCDVLIPSELRDGVGNVVASLIGDEAIANGCGLPVCDVTRKGRVTKHIEIPSAKGFVPASASSTSSLAKLYGGVHDVMDAAPNASLAPVLGMMMDAKREVYVHGFLERIVQTLLVLTLELHVEPVLSHTVLAYRAIDGVHAGIFMLKQLLRRGFVWGARADVHDFFPSIKVGHVAAALPAVVTLDDDLLGIILARMNAPIVRRVDHPAVASGAVGVHAPALGALYQGSTLAPLLSNVVGYVVLDAPFARVMRDRALLLRYSDDMIILARDRASAAAGLQLLHELAAGAGLELHVDPAKTSPEPVDLRESNIVFLGHRIAVGGVQLSADGFDDVVAHLADVDPADGASGAFVDAALRLVLDPSVRLDDLREAAAKISPEHLFLLEEAFIHVKANLRSHWIAKFQAFCDPVLRGVL